MAKVIMPPQITSLDELLDIVVHPDKFAARLTQMIEVRDAITSKLSTIQTVEEAEEYLVEARDRNAASREELAKALRIGSDASLAKQSMVEQMTKEQDAWTKAKELEQDALATYKRELMEKSERLIQAELALGEREQKLQDDQSLLAARRQKLDDEVERMNKRKELLNAI